MSSEIEYFEDRLALAFSDRYADGLKYVGSLRRWFVWNGQRWQADDSGAAIERCRSLCRETAERCGDMRAAEKLGRARTIEAVERLARSDRRHAVAVSALDADPWAYNTPAGTVDLRTGEMRPHRSDDLITKLAGASPEGQCPNWSAFLQTITGGDREFEDYLQRVVGYGLTGRTDEHVFFFLHGAGANGKSVFCNVINAVLGDYACTAAMDTFLSSASDRHPTELAALRGARLVTAIETERGRRWAEAKIKSITGGDRVAARYMRQDFFEYTPQFKLVMAGNDLPGLQQADEAIRRRLHVIPFSVTIPLDERDKGLTDRLLEERNGILAWAIDGCRQWQKEGLRPPAAVRDATRAYFDAADPIGRWIADACVVGAEYSSPLADLHKSYERYSRDHGEKPLSKRALSDALIRRGFSKRRTADERLIEGIAPQMRESLSNIVVNGE